MSKACNVSVPILLRRNTKEIKSLVQHYQWVRAEPSSKPRQSGFWAQSLGNLAEFHWSSGNLEAAGYLLAPAGSRLVLGMEEVKGSGSLAGWAHRILRGSAFSCYWTVPEIVLSSNVTPIPPPSPAAVITSSLLAEAHRTGMAALRGAGFPTRKRAVFILVEFVRYSV